MIVPLAIQRATRLKTREKFLLNEVVESESQFSLLTRSKVETIIGRSLRNASWGPKQLLDEAEKDAVYCSAKGVAIVLYWSSFYPVLLREIYDGPFLLFVRGKLPQNVTAQLGVVGTREPTGSGKKAAFRLGYQAALSDVPVVSGLARGIDGAAHRGCVANGGKTVAVLGSGIDTIYPREHRRLAADILEGGGAIVSEYPPGTPPLRYNFPARNRIISGMSRGTVIVQCPEKSGAMITADYALEHGRDLFVHRAGLSGYAGAGTNLLFEDGAKAIDGLEDIMKEWNISDKKMMNEKKESPWDAGARCPSNAGEAGALMADLLEKELLGAVSRCYGEYCGSYSNG